MRVNILAYQYNRWDGYGRFAAYIVAALNRAGHEAVPLFTSQANAPAWMYDYWGIDWAAPSVTIAPPFALQSTPGPGPHYLYTMTEGSRLPGATAKYPPWAEIIRKHNVTRLFVPCRHNADVFSAVGLPVYVVPGGTDPADYAPCILPAPERPYTFLALADRGARKGWGEVWEAFYKAFGTPADTPDVRLIIKARPDGNDLLQRIAGAANPDPRITILFEDMPDLREFYAMGNCFVIPSRSEGWGMPHREAAACGLPVITQRYSGMDDGYTDKWAIIAHGGRFEPIPADSEHIAGEWLRVDIGALAARMHECFDRPAAAARFGRDAAKWICNNQTWDHTAARLAELLQGHA